jgi:hypothetical protein
MTHDWAQAHRNSRAVFAAIVLSIGFLVLMLTMDNDQQTLLHTRQELATISAIKVSKRESNSRYSGHSITTHYLVSLVLINDEKINFILLQAPPPVGTQVPILVDTYDNGKPFYHYNMIDWMLLK